MNKKMGLPETLANVDFGHSDVPVKQEYPGRIKGSKNMTTVFKDQMLETFEKDVRKKFKRIVDSVTEAAVDGNMKAAEMVLSRVIPVNKAVDSDARTGDFSVTINIGNLVAPENITDPDKIISEQ